MNVPASGDPPSPTVDVGGAGAPESPISRFLADSEEHIQDLLIAHRIPPGDTAELLHQALSTLVYRWGELGDPKAWLSATLRAHCQRYWRRRGVVSTSGSHGGSDTAAGSRAGRVVLDFEPPEPP